MSARATLCSIALILSACGGTVTPLDSAPIDSGDRGPDATDVSATGDTTEGDGRAVLDGSDASDGPEIADDVAADSTLLDAREDMVPVDAMDAPDAQDSGEPSDTSPFDDALDGNAGGDALGFDADDTDIIDASADAASPDDAADEHDVETALDAFDPDSADIGDLDAFDNDAVTDVSADDAAEPADADAACPAEAPVRCDGVCVADTDSNPTRCGDLCEACPTPMNGTATCVAGACTSRCNPGRVLIGADCIDAPAPRPVRPMTNSRMTVANPTLRWVLPPGIDAARVTICSDRPCTAVALEVDAIGGSVRVPRELAAGVWYWKLRSVVGGGPSTLESATWQFRTPATSAPVESAWVSRPDFNGDGLDDFGINANVSGNGAVYFGNRGESTAPGIGIPGADANSWLQFIGDVDGDGLSDLSVDVNGGSASDGIHVRSGRVVGGTFPLINEIPHAVAGTIYRSDGGGDVDGDGYSDIVAIAPSGSRRLFRGGIVGLRDAGALTADTNSYSVALLDLDADGFDDILMAGNSLRWFRGGPTGVGDAQTLLSTGDSRNGIVFGIGDVNGDGYLDAAWIEHAYYSARIQAAVIVGGALGPTVGPLQDIVPDGEYQLIVGPVGDADGDGIVDVSATSGAVLGLNAVHSRVSGFDRADSTQIATGCIAGNSEQIGDWNGDGSLDTLVQCSDRSYVILTDRSGVSPIFRLIRVEPTTTGGQTGFAML